MNLSRRDLLVYLAAMGVSVIAGPLSAKGALKAPVRLYDAELLHARTGKSMHVVSEVMRDRVVAMNFVFTVCSSTCPLQSASLARAQRLLGASMGREVTFLSISIDPFNDTPAQLNRFADAHGAGQDWHFFTGNVNAIDTLREGFDLFDPRRDDHPPVIAIGRADASDWSRLYGIPSPEVIVEEVNAWLA